LSDPCYRALVGRTRVNWGRLLLGSMHFGETKFLRCPVDRRWRIAKPVPAASPGAAV
jgi:hypothetical protein